MNASRVLSLLLIAVTTATLSTGCPFNAKSRGDLFSAGVSFQRERDFDMAAELFRRIVDHNPEDAAAWRRLAECEAGRGRVDAATNAYRRYVELNPDAVPLVRERLASLGVDPIVLANRPGAEDDDAAAGVDGGGDGAESGDPTRDPPPLGGKRVSDEMLGEWAPRGTYYPGGAGAPAGVFGAILPTKLERSMEGPRVKGPAWAIATDERGRMVVMGTADGRVRVMEFGREEPVATFSAGAGVTAATVEPGGERFAIATAAGTVTVYGLDGARISRLDTGAKKAVRAVGMERGGHRLYAAGDNRELIIWHADDAVVEDRMTLPVAAVALGLAPESRFMAVGLEDGRVIVIDPVAGTREKVLKAHGARCTGVAFTGDARTLVTTSWDGTAHVYRYGTWEPMAAHPLHAHIVTALATGARVAVTGSADLRLKVWEAETGTELVHLLGHEHEVESVTVSADGRRVASVDYSGAVRFWELR